MTPLHLWRKPLSTLVAILIALYFPSLVTAQGATPTLQPTPQSSPHLLSGLDPSLFAGKENNAPTLIDADTFSLNHEKRTFQYKGNVVVHHGEVILYADIVEGTYSEENQLQTITARGKNVRIEKGTVLKTSSQLATYDVVKGIAILTDNPSVEQNESILSADKITVYVKENRSEAEGQVRVKLVKKATSTPTPIPSPQMR